MDEPQNSGESNESEQDVTELELTSAVLSGDSSSYLKNTCEVIFQLQYLLYNKYIHWKFVIIFIFWTLCFISTYKALLLLDFYV